MRKAPFLAFLVAVLLLTGLVRPAAAEPCFEGIAEATTRKVFAALLAERATVACTLVTVRTDGSQMHIVWEKDGHSQEPIVLHPTVRLSGSQWGLSASVPESTAQACPGVAAATTRAVEASRATLAETECPGDDSGLDARAARLIAGNSLLRVARADACGVDVALEGGHGNVVGSLALLPPGAGTRVRSKSFEVSITAHAPAPSVIEALVGAARDAIARDDGKLFTAPARVSCRDDDPHPWLLAVAALIAAAFAAIVGLVRKARISFAVRLPHAVPATIQVLLFAYWSLYWHQVSVHARDVAMQVLLAYALDAAFSFACFGSWRIGLSLLPIVFSASLFAWVYPAGAVVLLVVAVGSKALVRRAGMHVLNPSAAGLAVVGILTIVAPSVFGYTGVFHTTNLPPNMAELVILLALAPQLRFPIVLVSLGAVAGLSLPWFHTVSVGPALMLLAIALLATDPATIPRTPAGRLLFGFLVGAATGVASAVLTRTGRPDDFAKVLAIPVANALVPWFDRVGARLPWRWIEPRYNLAHVAAWLLLATLAVRKEKPSLFEASLHYTWGTPLVVRGGDDVPRCSLNPTFCRPFTFFAEAAGWAARGRGESAPPHP